MTRNFGFADPMFFIASNFIFIVFAIIVIIFIITAIRGIKQWSYNNSQPLLIVSAKIVSKRTHISNHVHNSSNSMHSHHSTTRYYATFEVESGSRMEFQVTGQEFGLLAEGDTGKLKFQGSRYLGFERI